MAYLTNLQLVEVGFKKLGKHVKISDKASIYNADQIEIGDYSRVDDFCVISGNVILGKYNHITPMCLIAGGLLGVVLEDFCTLAYGAKIFSQSDDYSGNTMTNSLLAKKFKNEKFAAVHLGRHVIVGTSSVIFPGVTVAEGGAIGAMTLVTKNTTPWGVYVGIPARKVRDREKKILELEPLFLKEYPGDDL